MYLQHSQAHRALLPVALLSIVEAPDRPPPWDARQVCASYASLSILLPAQAMARCIGSDDRARDDRVGVLRQKWLNLVGGRQMHMMPIHFSEFQPIVKVIQVIGVDQLGAMQEFALGTSLDNLLAVGDDEGVGVQLGKLAWSVRAKIDKGELRMLTGRAVFHGPST